MAAKPTRATTLPLFEGRRSLRTAAFSRPALNTVGLFAGIGGLELGLRRAGHDAKLFVEIEPGAQAVLRARFPDVPLHDDVTTLSELPRRTDLLVGGFPCQDLSQAGQTKGIEGARSGLVGQVFRLLEQQPVRWVLLENVPFMLQLAKGRAMEVIVAAFERLGYRWAYRVVDSRAFGLPQRRERVYFLAALDADPREVLFADDAGQPEQPPHSWKVAHGFYWTEGIRGLGWAVDAVPTLKGGSTVGIPSPPAIMLPSGRVVTPHIRDAERMQGFEAGWTEPAESVVKRGHRWKLVGNAVTVDVAAWIGARLRAPDARGAAVGGSPLRSGSPWPKAAWNVGEGRFTADVSQWPDRRGRPPLPEFLQHDPAPLSLKATTGFLARTEVSSLRFPPGFIERLKRHRQAMGRDSAPVVQSA
jgi:DNA (cytosine-5)-methyltransferase 1